MKALKFGMEQVGLKLADLAQVEMVLVKIRNKDSSGSNAGGGWPQLSATTATEEFTAADFQIKTVTTS